MDLWLCWVFVAVRGLSQAEASRGCSLVAVPRLLIVVASPFVEHGLYSAGSAVVVHRLSCPVQKSPDTPGSPEGNPEGPGTASSEPLLPS